MTTASDVAQLAGVSTMTVSRVISNSGYVKETTRDRVEMAISQLGYVPNALARQLRSKRTKTLALVLSDITNPYFTTIAHGVEELASHRGFTVILGNTNESGREEARYLRLLVERQVDGVILVPARSSGSSLRLLETHHIPVVVVDRRVAAREIDGVTSDSVAGARALTEHLLALGHRRIAILTGRRAISTATDRVAGCRRALKEAGLALDEALIHYGIFNFGSGNQADGYRMARDVLEAGPPRPTAIFAANNFIAYGAIRALHEAGLRVPEDMSVVAFDDLPPEWVPDPFLTVAVQPAYEIGRTAATMLLDRVSGERCGPAEQVVFPVEVRIRRSSAPPPAPPAPGLN